MRNLLKAGIVAFAFSLIFISVETANAQNRREARREYRQDVRQARREYKQNVRSARREYRQDTGRRINNGYYRSRSNRGYAVSSSRRAYPQRYRYVYRNGRRYTVRY